MDELRTDLPGVGRAAPDPRRRALVAPWRVLWQSDVGTASGTDRLVDAGLSQASVWRPTVATLRSAGAILLDFGRELHGGVRITRGAGDAGRPLRVRVRFGESATEAMAEPDQDHAIHDDAILVPRMGSVEHGQTGFRFVRLDLVEPDGATLHLQGVHAVELMRPDESAGAFCCSDPLVDQVWQTSVRTVHLCMQDHLYDGIKRDRLVWMGDLHPEVRVIAAAFGAHPIVPASLDFVRDESPMPKWMNATASYSPWWVVIQRDWFLHFGDRDYLEAQRGYLVTLLGRLDGCVTGDGREALDGWRFLDWPSEGDAAAKDAGLHALMLMAATAGAELSDILGERDAASRARSTAARLRAFAPPPTPSKQANALRVLANLADPLATNADVLAVDPLRGLSTFYGYYVLQARAIAGDVAGGLSVLRAYWGGMLALGATSFWEHFDVGWRDGAARIDELPGPGEVDVHARYGEHCYKGYRHSLCHGWAGGPAAWLSEHVLGVTPLAPGFARVRIRPNLGDLDFAEGTVPTPRGLIHVCQRRGARPELSLPAGVELEA